MKIQHPCFGPYDMGPDTLKNLISGIHKIQNKMEIEECIVSYGELENNEYTILMTFSGSSKYSVDEINIMRMKGEKRPFDAAVIEYGTWKRIITSGKIESDKRFVELAHEVVQFLKANNSSDFYTNSVLRKLW